MTIDWWRQIVRAIGWTQHGGSGFSCFTYRDLLQLSVDDLEAFAQLADQTRAKEAKQLKEAAGK